MKSLSPIRDGKKTRYVKPTFEVFHRPPSPESEDQTISGRLQAAIGDLFARIRNDPQERLRTVALATEIIEFARMRSNDRGSVLIEVPEVAYHLRETPRHVRQSLRLLEIKGIAKPTPSKDHWKLVA